MGSGKGQAKRVKNTSVPLTQVIDKLKEMDQTMPVSQVDFDRIMNEVAEENKIEESLSKVIVWNELSEDNNPFLIRNTSDGIKERKTNETLDRLFEEDNLIDGEIIELAQNNILFKESLKGVIDYHRPVMLEAIASYDELAKHVESEEARSILATQINDTYKESLETLLYDFNSLYESNKE